MPLNTVKALGEERAATRIIHLGPEQAYLEKMTPDFLSGFCLAGSFIEIWLESEARGA